MSIEVTGNMRPGKPPLAVAVSGLLLVSTLIGAAALTHARNRPISLTPTRPVPAVRGLSMGWPQGWLPIDLAGRTGPAISGVVLTTGTIPDKVLFLLSDRVSDSYVSPQYAAIHVLKSAGSQLAISPVSQDPSASVVIAASPAEMLGRPAFQLAYPVYFRRQMYWALLRVASEPNGQIIGLLLLTHERTTPSTERILDHVSESMQYEQKSVDVLAALKALKLKARALDGQLAHLKGYIQQMPAVGPVGVTFMPEGHSAGESYAIEIWTSWLANRRTLQDLASTWFRRMQLQAEPPGDSGWVQRSGARIWRAPLVDKNNGGDSLVTILYLRELPDKRVVWARTTAAASAIPEDTVLDLLASIQTVEPLGWDYDEALTTAGSALASLANERVTAYYQANSGRQDFAFANAAGRPAGTARYVTTIKADGMIARIEQINKDSGVLLLKEEKASQLRADLSSFQGTDSVMLGQETSLRMLYDRPDAASPVSLHMQFGRAAPIEASFHIREAFLPDSAIDPASWYLARKSGTNALFRIVGMDPQVPESILLMGLGRQQIEVNGRVIDAFICLQQQDTHSGPDLVLFDERGVLLGYLLQDGSSILRTALAAQSQPSHSEQ